jgi:hypothetical protein
MSLLLNALKLHLKVIKFSNPEKKFPKKLQLMGDIPPPPGVENKDLY